MRGFGCDQALPGCDSTRLSQQLRLVTAADVPLCSATRELTHTHTHAGAYSHVDAYSQTFKRALTDDLSVRPL